MTTSQYNPSRDHSSSALKEGSEPDSAIHDGKHSMVADGGFWEGRRTDQKGNWGWHRRLSPTLCEEASLTPGCPFTDLPLRASKKSTSVAAYQKISST